MKRCILLDCFLQLITMHGLYYINFVLFLSLPFLFDLNGKRDQFSVFST